jgi:hypothetical protein
MYKPMSARESPIRSLLCAAYLTAVLSSTNADDRPIVLKSRWEFNSKRGAVLLMYRPRLICLPAPFLSVARTIPSLRERQ